MPKGETQDSNIPHSMHQVVARLITARWDEGYLSDLRQPQEREDLSSGHIQLHPFHRTLRIIMDTATMGMVKAMPNRKDSFR